MKHILYLLSWLILAVLLVFLANTLLELFSGRIFSPGYLQIAVYILGAVGGLFAGKYFWRVIYIEKRRWSK